MATTTKKLIEVTETTDLASSKALVVQDGTVKQADISLLPYEALTTAEIDTICTL